MSDRLDQGLARLEERFGELSDLLRRAIEDAPNPERTVAALERWLGAMGSPDAAMAQMEAAPGLCRHLLALLGSSRQIADSMVHQPELSALVLDPAELMRPIRRSALTAEGRELMGAAISPRHAMDRLRYLKQKTTIRILAQESAGVLEGPSLWKAITNLSDAIVRLVHAHVLAEVGVEANALSVIVMGKAGGRELNISSDLDLLFVADEASPDLERAAGKIIRSLSEGMGRGSLYRVDMRLRPFGSHGPLLTTWDRLQTYLDRHAEPWEHMALIRSRAIAGRPDAGMRWRRLRRDFAFKGRRGDWAIESILAARERTEEQAPESDLKRGAGGLRDIEFSIQLLQYTIGYRSSRLHTASTLKAIERLRERKALSPEVADVFTKGYLLLRSVEHNSMVATGQQTHALPDDPAEAEAVARRVGFTAASALKDAIDLTRARVRQRYIELFGPLLSDPLPQADIHWVSLLPQAERFRRVLADSKDGRERAERLEELAPALIPHLSKSVAITEQVISGEVMEDADHVAPVQQASGEEALAKALRRSWLALAARRALEPEFGFSELFADCLDAAFIKVREQTAPDLTVVALGSLAGREVLLHSDSDVLLLGSDERQAQDFYGMCRRLKALGAPLSADSRLRPEGNQGSLSVSLAAWETYKHQRMEAWELFAASRARLIAGDEALFADWQSLLYGHTISKGNLIKLIQMRGRVMRERGAAEPLKVGAGGQDEALWAVHLSLLARPDLRHADVSVFGNLRRLVMAEILSQEESDALWQAHKAMADLRMQNGLQGRPQESFPHDGDKLPPSFPELREEAARLRAAVADRLLDQCS